EVLVARTHTTDVREMRERDGCGATGCTHQSALRLPIRASLDSMVLISARTGGGARARPGPPPPPPRGGPPTFPAPPPAPPGPRARRARERSEQAPDDSGRPPAT